LLLRILSNGSSDSTVTPYSYNGRQNAKKWSDCTLPFPHYLQPQSRLAASPI
jgi:hypothetical protein